MVDPTKLIRQIPEGMRISRLRQKLGRILANYTLQLQLRSGCNKVLKVSYFSCSLNDSSILYLRVCEQADSVGLSKRLHKAQRRAVRVDTAAFCPLSQQQIGIARATSKGKRRGRSKSVVVFGDGSVYQENALQSALADVQSPHWNSIEVYQTQIQAKSFGRPNGESHKQFRGTGAGA